MLWYLVRALLLPRSTPVVWIWSFAFLCLRAWKPHPVSSSSAEVRLSFDVERRLAACNRPRKNDANVVLELQVRKVTARMMRTSRDDVHFSA